MMRLLGTVPACLRAVRSCTLQPTCRTELIRPALVLCPARAPAFSYCAFSRDARGLFNKVFLTLTAGSSEDEQQIKDATSATLRCIPFDQPEGLPKPCLLTGASASEVAIFAKAY